MDFLADCSCHWQNEVWLHLIAISTSQIPCFWCIMTKWVNDSTSSCSAGPHQVCLCAVSRDGNERYRKWHYLAVPQQVPTNTVNVPTSRQFHHVLGVLLIRQGFPISLYLLNRFITELMRKLGRVLLERYENGWCWRMKNVNRIYSENVVRIWEALLSEIGSLEKRRGEQLKCNRPQNRHLYLFGGCRGVCEKLK